MRLRPRRTDFGRRFFNWYRGRVLPVARPRPARPRCPHKRQSYDGHQLPCADPRCPEGAPDPMFAPFFGPPVSPSFSEWMAIDGGIDHFVEKSEFRRVEWGGRRRDGWIDRCFTWEQTRGPDTSLAWRPALPWPIRIERERFQRQWGIPWEAVEHPLSSLTPDPPAATISRR